MPYTLLHLVGSAVSDFYADLSRLYAADCLAAIEDPTRYESVIAYVSPDGSWRFPTDLSRESIAAAKSMPAATAIEGITILAPDAVVPQMFCLPGMTTYRGLFDLLGIPYLGNTPDVMAIGANKAKARAIVAAAGVRVPEGEVLRRGETPRLAPPTVVKPVDADNSLGVTLVRTPDEYPGALAEAFTHSESVLVERYIELGREVRCGIVELDGEPFALPLEEYAVDPDRNPIRGVEDKITRQAGGELRLEAKEASRAWMVGLADRITPGVWDAAKRCHVALGCRHYSLFDFRIDADGQPWFLEAGLYCSFAEKSVIPMMAAAADYPLHTLFAATLYQAIHGT